MQATFQIAADPRLGLLTITLAGFFYPEDVSRYLVARNEAQRALRTQPNQHLTLVDLRGMEVQMQNSVELFRATMNDLAARSRRLAFVAPVGLAKLQMTRAAGTRGASFFPTMEEARAWLLMDERQKK